MTEEKCVDCGTLDEVEFGPCPFASEIWDDYDKMWLCDDCAIRRADDI